MTPTTRTLALALALTTAGSALAAPPGKPPAPKPPVTTMTPFRNTARPVSFHQFNTSPFAGRYIPNDHLKFGTKFEYGYFYTGYHHDHWSKIYVHPFWNVPVYFCPYTLVEYYWCAPDYCFYPLTYRPYGTLVFP
jgi:hypothetical protein